MKFYKSIIFLGIILAFWNCNTKYYIRSVDANTPILKNNKLKIALIGFYPNHVTSSTSSGKTRTTIAGQNYSKPMKQYFKNGIDVVTLATKNVREDIKEEQVKEFVRNYLEKTKKSGIDEMTKILDIKEKPNKEFSYKLRKIDADYLLIGYLLPAFESETPLTILPNIITRLGALFTLGTIPMYSRKEVKPEFHLFDKNLQLIKTFTYKTTYTTITSWWTENEQTLKEENTSGNAGSTPLSKVFIPEIQVANIDVTNFLNELK